MNLKELLRNPVNIVLTVVFVLAFGITTFLLVSANSDLRKENRNLKKENKVYEATNKRLKTSNDSIQSDINSRDKVIAQSTLIFDSLKTKLAELNNRKIVTNYESYNTVSNLSLDGQISLLSRYLAEADSLTK